ncbi:MAG TPA: Clp protease N-terminal domain-containing protein [Acidimicrobiales bacterium]|nr:Clp protease N-terminal domain-containing protein [Acidimicrobiales bacterium]
MFERFTDRARSVLVLAQNEARQRGDPVIGTEHLLVALLHVDGGVAAKALLSLDISLDAVGDEVEKARTRAGETTGGDATTPSGSPAFTPRAKKVLELGLREALQLGHSYIGTEHILLGLVREGEGVGAQVLRGLGADLATVRRQVIEVLSGYPAARPVVQEGGVSQALHFVGPESPASVPPSCPQCHAALANAARFRVISVAPGAGDPGQAPLSMDVVYCSRCGVTLEMFKSGRPGPD